MSTRLDIFNSVKTVFKRDDQDDSIDIAISNAYKEMLAAIGHHKTQAIEYKTIVVGRAQYALPSTYLRFNHPAVLIDPLGGSDATSSYPLRFMSKDEYDFLEPNPDNVNPSTGIPWGYTFFENSIFITSIPDRTYTIQFNLGGEPVPLLNDVDELVLSPLWDETVMAGALQRLFFNNKLYDDAKMWHGVYINGHVGDSGILQGGLKLLQDIETGNTQSVLIVKNQPL